MDITEVKQRRDELNIKILNLIGDFERATETTVDEVNLIQERLADGSKLTVGVFIDVSIIQGGE